MASADQAPGAATSPQHVDWHCHSLWSDGFATVGELAERAAQRGLKLGISDHAFFDNPRLRTRAELDAYLADLAQYPVLRGIEISIGERAEYDGQPAEGLLDRFDYVIASLHDVRIAEGIVWSTPYLNWRAGLFDAYRPDIARYERRAYFESLLAALDDSLARWPVAILGHFCLLPELASDADAYDPEPDPEPDAVAQNWLDEVIRRCVARGVALELNSKSRVPHRSLARRALELGATFSLGSDAHTLEAAGDVSYGLGLVRELAIPPERILGAHSAK